MPLCDVAGHRNGGAPNLRGKAEDLGPRKPCWEGVRLTGQDHRFLPDLQIAAMSRLHDVDSMPQQSSLEDKSTEACQYAEIPAEAVSPTGSALTALPSDRFIAAPALTATAFRRRARRSRRFVSGWRRPCRA